MQKIRILIIFMQVKGIYFMGGIRMIKKTLERKLVVENGIDSFEYQVPMELEYYVLESKTDYMDELAEKNVYGVGIAKRINETCYEEENAKNLSCSIKEVKNFIKKLADNEVTPVCLDYIVADLLGV